MTSRISQTPARVAQRTPSERPAPQRTATRTQATAVESRGWSNRGSKLAQVATNAKGFVDAFAAPTPTKQKAVEASQKQDAAAIKLLKATSEELATQLEDRDQPDAAAQVRADTKKFIDELPPVAKFQANPGPRTQDPVEANHDRMGEVMNELGKYADKLNEATKEPWGENQSAYNSQARAGAVAAEAKFATSFHSAVDAGRGASAIKKADAFFKTLPKKIDVQIENRGGSLEPLERAGAANRALTEMAAKL